MDKFEKITCSGRAGDLFYIENEVRSLQDHKKKPMAKRRWMVAVKCNDLSCSWQYGGECRAYLIKVKDGSLDCPYEDTRRLREHAPAYKEQEIRRRS